MKIYQGQIFTTYEIWPKWLFGTITTLLTSVVIEADNIKEAEAKLDKHAEFYKKHDKLKKAKFQVFVTSPL